MSEPVLFDFDGTLVRGDSAAGYLKRLFDDSLPRRLLALAGLPLLAPAFAWWRTARAMTSAYLWLATVGRDAEWLEVAREAYVADIAERSDEVLIAAAMTCLRRHLEAGEEVVIVTGADQPLAERLWRALDGPAVSALIGSRLRPACGGLVAERHCFGPRKLDALAEAGIRPPFAVVYTDSARDLPLLRHARRPVLVEPSRSTLARVRRSLGAVEVLSDRRRQRSPQALR